MIKKISNMTQEEKNTLAKSMANPVRCGGMHYGKDGRPRWMHGGKSCTIEEHNDIIRKANPNFSDTELGAMLFSEEEMLKLPEYASLKDKLIEDRKNWKDCNRCGRCAPRLTVDEDAAEICSACLRVKDRSKNVKV